MAINIPASAFKKFNEAVQLFMQNCTLTYPAKREDCPNCIQSGFGGRSVNVYQPGGPAPFENGAVCPYCHGDGYKYSEVTEDIELRVYWEKKSWINLNTDITVPDGSIQTIGYMSDYDKMIKANNLTVYFKDSEGNKTFTRWGEGYPQGFKQNPTQYIAMFWKRV